MDLEDKDAERIIRESIDFRIKELEATATLFTSIVATLLSLILVSFSLYRNPAILGIEKSLAMLLSKTIVIVSSIIGLYAIYGISYNFLQLRGFLPHANDYYMNRLELAAENLDDKAIKKLSAELN